MYTQVITILFLSPVWYFLTKRTISLKVMDMISSLKIIIAISITFGNVRNPGSKTRLLVCFHPGSGISPHILRSEFSMEVFRILLINSEVRSLPFLC